MASDPLFFLEGFTSVVDYGGRGLIPTVFNTAQMRYYRQHWLGGVVDDIVGKSRKWGFSTERVGLGMHETIYTPGRIFRIVAHRMETAKALNLLIKTFYESAWYAIKAKGGEPLYYLPRIVSDTAIGYKFAHKGQIIIETAAGDGVGQGDRTDDLYVTEYSDWRNPEQTLSALEGSHPLASKTNRTTIDFNAHGKHGDAYIKYEAARLGPDHPDWNGYHAFFAGVLDCPEVYPPDTLVKEKRKHGLRFPEVYPSNDREMWLASEKSVFDASHIDDAEARGRSGYCGKVCDSVAVVKFLHGVDTASGFVGGDFQACVTLGQVDGLWTEAAPPIHGHWPEPEFARMVDRQVREYLGPNVVERNVGALVISTMRDLGTPNMYQHRHRDKVTGSTRYEVGFPTTRPSKRMMIGDLQDMLRDGEIALVTPLLIEQIREYEWRLKDDGSEDEELAGNPKVKGKHDDLVVALMLALQALHRPQLRFAAVA